MVADVYFGEKNYKPFILSVLAGNSEERLMDLIYKLKTNFVTCTIEQILHHVRNLLFTVYMETTLLKGKSIHAF